MLQWMGGSRRKVNNSRKSMQKRQKQYFEQRKRQQQQQQQTDGLENFAEGINSGDHQKEHRSLDILSLLNLSTVAQECRSSCTTERKISEVDASTANYHFTKCEPTIFTNTVLPAHSVEFKEAGNPQGRQVDTVPPMKVSLDVPDGHDNASSAIGGKLNHWKASDNQLSVFDLLGDEGLDGNSEARPRNEDHVAFSVEGLGNVGTTTPVHSPQQSSRIHSYGCFSPLKAARRLQSSKNFHYMHDDLELEMDPMMQDIDMSLSSNSLGVPSYSRGRMDSISNRKQKLSTFDHCMQLEDHSNKIKSSIGDQIIFNDIEDDEEDIWHARSSFLEDNFIDESKYDMSWKNWPCHMDGDSANMYNFGSHDVSDFSFKEPNLLKKRDTKKATKMFNILESPDPYYGHQESKYDDFLNSDPLRYPMAGNNFHFREVTNHPNMSYFTMEDPRDILSSLSEESCSSSAVRGKVANNSQSMVKQSMRRHGDNLSGPKYGVKNRCAEKMPWRDGDDVQQGEKGSVSGISTRISNLSRSKAVQNSHCTFQKKVESSNSWLLEEVCPSAEISLGASSFCQTSETKSASSGWKLWAEDPFGAFTPKLDINSKSSFQNSKHDAPIECSHSGGLFSEKFAFIQPAAHMHSFDSPTFSNVEVELAKPDFYPDSKEEVISPESSHVAGSGGDFEHPDFAVDELVTEDRGKDQQIQSTDSQSFEIEKEVSTGNTSPSSENEHQIDSSDAKGYDSEREAKNETSELLMKTTCSSENAEGPSLSTKIPNLESSVNGELCHHNTEIRRLLCQNQITANANTEPEPQNTVSEARNIEVGGQIGFVNRSHQVLMLESYVLQLLCVQKVLKEASAKDDTKKVRWLLHKSQLI